MSQDSEPEFLTLNWRTIGSCIVGNGWKILETGFCDFLFNCYFGVTAAQVAWWFNQKDIKKSKLFVLEVRVMVTTMSTNGNGTVVNQTKQGSKSRPYSHLNFSCSLYLELLLSPFINLPLRLSITPVE